MVEKLVEKFNNIPASWLLLYINSTIDIIVNKVMVSNISKSYRPITLHCNAGLQQVEFTANLIGYGRVCYKPKAISNIPSLSRYNRKYRVVFDSKDRN